MVIYGNSGVRHPVQGLGFEVYRAQLAGQRVGLDHLNPQTQERLIK